MLNIEGFIKYTSIHEGNIADCKTLSSMIEKLHLQTNCQKPIIVLDAGIATQDNLTLLETKGYRYVCVNRTKLKDFSSVENKPNVLLETKSKQEILIKAIRTSSNTDYYLQITSTAKARKEQSMNNLFETRFEEALQKIQNAIHKKGGIKKIDKVNERIPQVCGNKNIPQCIITTTSALSAKGETSQGGQPMQAKNR